MLPTFALQTDLTALVSFIEGNALALLASELRRGA